MGLANLPLVSVVIPTYNRPNMLKNAIDSVLRQSYPNIEMIVVDDNNPGSKARMETQSVMSQYAAIERVRYYCHSKNRNGAAARNTGIKNARGKYIALLDDDDEFLEEKIELQVEKLESLDQSWGMCYTHFIRKKGNRVIDKGIETKEGTVTKDILQGNFYISAGSNLMIRRDIVHQIGGFDESFPRKQDLEFLIRVSQETQIACIPKTCLVINKDDRQNVLSERQVKMVTEQFLDMFDGYISKLAPHEQRKVEIAQYLLMARYYLIRGDFVKVHNICRNHGITLVTLLRYTCYLLKRRLLKECYGFRV